MFKNFFLTLLIVILLLIFSFKTERFINSGTLEYTSSYYLAGICFLKNIEKTKLSKLAYKLGCTRKNNYIKYKMKSEKWHVYENEIKTYGDFIIKFYKDKVLNDNEMKCFIYDLMNLIDRDEYINIIILIKKYLNICGDNIDSQSYGQKSHLR